MERSGAAMVSGVARAEHETAGKEVVIVNGKLLARRSLPGR
jgi:hypothetical protein